MVAGHGVLFTLTASDAAAGICLHRRLTGRLRDWQTPAASPDQLRTDRARMERILA